MMRHDEIEQEEYDNIYEATANSRNGPVTQTNSIANGEMICQSLLFVPNGRPSEQFNKYGHHVDGYNAMHVEVEPDGGRGQCQKARCA